MDFIEPCFGIGHNLSLICQMTSEDIKHQLIIIREEAERGELEKEREGKGGGERGGGGELEKENSYSKLYFTRMVV